MGRIMAAVATLALAGGCASAPGDYPSLALRENERVTGAFEAPRAIAFVPSAPTPATLESLGALTTTATSAHEAFLASAREATPIVERASGSPVGSENWAVAQVAIAGLESRRGVAMVALADLDRLYVDAVTQGGETLQIEGARQVVEAQVHAQDTRIAGLLAQVAR